MKCCDITDQELEKLIEEVEMEGLMWKILGAALKGTVSGFLGGIIGGVVGQVSPDIVTAAVGYYMHSRMSGNWKDFGEGLLIASVAQIISPMVSQFAGGIVGGGQGSQSQGQQYLATGPYGY